VWCGGVRGMAFVFVFVCHCLHEHVCVYLIEMYDVASAASVSYVYCTVE
jgi:hypothetical protein